MSQKNADTWFDRNDRWRKGHEKEEEAQRWLQALADGSSRRVIAKNFHARQGELDLVVEEMELCAPFRLELVFVEVRARAPGRSWEDAISSVSQKKRHRIERAAEVFLLRYRGKARSMRFDVLAWDGGEWRLWKEAWSAASR